METEINELNPNKSSGMDDIPDNMLKESVDIVKSPLTELFNTYVENQQFPNKLKYAIVTPLFKKDDNTDKANFRPISALPSISTFLKGCYLNKFPTSFKTKFHNIFVDSEKASPPNTL